MNRQEQRTLRAIEKNLRADDPKLAEQLSSFGGGTKERLYRIACWLALPILILGAAAGDVVLLVAGLLLTLWVVLTWTVRASR